MNKNVAATVTVQLIASSGCYRDASDAAAYVKAKLDPFCDQAAKNIIDTSGFKWCVSRVVTVAMPEDDI